MTAVDARRGVPDALLVGASPRAIAGYLFPEDRQRFETEYEAALDKARTSYELGGVLRLVEHWRRIAALQADPAGFRDSVRSIAEVVSGEPVSDGEPFEGTRRRAGI